MKDLLNYSLLPHNTFHIAATCKRFVEYASVEELQNFIKRKTLQSDERLLHIGGGSNLLFTADFDGTVLHSAIRGITVENAEGENNDSVIVRAGASHVWDDFVAYCTTHGYYGLENLSLIPGEVGASAVQNIGAYGSEAADFIHTVETVELATGRTRTFTAEECCYGYRDSIFKRELRGQYAVTYVSYRLSRRFSPRTDYGGLARELEHRHIAADALTPQSLRDLVIDIRRSKLPDPAELGNAGSFFINPVMSAEKAQELLAKYPAMPHYDVAGGVKIPAGWLIEQCGWKGKAIAVKSPDGRDRIFGVYSEQALVLVNFANSRGQDIVDLSNAIRYNVRELFGIDIHPEVNFI